MCCVLSLVVPSIFLTGPEGLGPVFHLLPAASTPATLSIRPSRILNPVEDWGFPPTGEEMAFDEDPSKSLKVDAATCRIYFSIIFILNWNIFLPVEYSLLDLPLLGTFVPPPLLRLVEHFGRDLHCGC